MSVDSMLFGLIRIYFALLSPYPTSRHKSLWDYCSFFIEFWMPENNYLFGFQAETECVYVQFGLWKYTMWQA